MSGRRLTLRSSQPSTSVSRPAHSRVGTNPLGFRRERVVLGNGTRACTAWLDQRAHTLKHAPDGARQVLTALARSPIRASANPIAAAEARDGAMAYFTKRLVQLQYAAFQAAGYPIGSGSTESANKAVVEARLKGSGMHWAREHVNPLVALRTVACTNRWGETWPRITARLRRDADQRRRARWQARHPPTESPAAVPPPPPAIDRNSPPRGKSIVNGRPTAFHPWKRQPCLAGGRRATGSPN